MYYFGQTDDDAVLPETPESKELERQLLLKSKAAEPERAAVAETEMLKQIQVEQTKRDLLLESQKPALVDTHVEEPVVSEPVAPVKKAGINWCIVLAGLAAGYLILRK